jgi:hypothetical protein
MKILMVLTSHDKRGNTGEKTGLIPGKPSLRTPTCTALSRINAEMKRPLKP